MSSPNVQPQSSASEWNQLVVLATTSATAHVVKAVCLTADLGASTRVRLYCFTPIGNPLGSGTFATEEGLHQVFSEFSPGRVNHPVFDIVFEETDNSEFPGSEGVILGIRDANQMISSTDLDRLMAVNP